jgi:hypothetical protein
MTSLALRETRFSYTGTLEKMRVNREIFQQKRLCNEAKCLPAAVFLLTLNVSVG